MLNISDDGTIASGFSFNILLISIDLFRNNNKIKLRNSNSESRFYLKLIIRTNWAEILKKIFPEKTKIKIGFLNIPFHAMFVHFPIALYTAAVFFLFLALFSDKDSFRNSYFYLMIMATLFTPISHFTGILEWKKKYRGVRTHIFINKNRYGLILILVGGVCTTWYWFYPGILDNTGVLNIVFIILNIFILPLVGYLGHLGGKLVYGLPH